MFSGHAVWEYFLLKCYGYKSMAYFIVMMLIQNNTNDYNSWNVPLLVKELRDGINQEEKDDIQKTIPVPDIYKDKYE